MVQRFSIHRVSSHIFSQGTACVTAAAASAGKDGQEMLVRSGREQSTDERRALESEKRVPILTEWPGSAPQPFKTRLAMPPKKTKQGCKSACI